LPSEALAKEGFLRRKDNIILIFQY
jgi:hypothetical protein